MGNTFIIRSLITLLVTSFIALSPFYGSVMTFDSHCFAAGNEVTPSPDTGKVGSNLFSIAPAEARETGYGGEKGELSERRNLFPLSEPVTLLLIGCGLVLLAGFGLKKFAKIPHR